MSEKKVSPRRVLMTFLLGLVACVILIVTQPYWLEQSRNIRRIDQWVAEVKGSINKYKTQAHLESLDVGHWTGDDGLVFIHASVRDPAAEENLKKFINTLNPPRPIKWEISILARP